MLTNEEKEAIEFACAKTEKIIDTLSQHPEDKRAKQGEIAMSGFLYALETFFEFDSNGHCVGLKESTVHEYLALKYLPPKEAARFEHITFILEDCQPATYKTACTCQLKAVEPTPECRHKYLKV